VVLGGTVILTLSHFLNDNLSTGSPRSKYSRTGDKADTFSRIPVWTIGVMWLPLLVVTRGRTIIRGWDKEP
jgi:hypothetical protein